jgi:uncharacterized protein with PIN domain
MVRAQVARASVRFYAELNEYVSDEKRFRDALLDFTPPIDVRTLIESAGVPATEVDLVLVNGQSVDFGYAVHDGDRISVYPVFEAFDISTVAKVRDRPLRTPRFVLDVHLGKLATFLRLFGFDALFHREADDARLVQTANEEKRVLLSKDRDLIGTASLLRGYLVKADDPRLQVQEVLQKFDLYRLAAPFQRCLRCNALLETVPKQDVVHLLPQRIRESLDEFWRCPTCLRIYWKGSHYQRMSEFIRQVTGGESAPPQIG